MTTTIPTWRALAYVTSLLENPPFGCSVGGCRNALKVLLDEVPMLTCAGYEHDKDRMVCRGEVDLYDGDGRRSYGVGEFTLFIEPSLRHGFRARVVFDKACRSVAYRFKYRGLVLDVLVDALDSPAPEGWDAGLFQEVLS